MTPRDTQLRRLPSGIDGLDSVLEGGYPSERSYLIEGAAGTGKTTLAMHFLLAGAAAGASCTYVTLSESEAELRDTARAHGWELGGIEIVDFSSRHPEDLASADYSVLAPDEVELGDIVEGIRSALERIRPERVVIDPISALKAVSGSSARYRQHILALKEFFRSLEVTALVLSPAAEDAMDEYLATAVSGVISVRQLPGDYGTGARFLNVRKIRGTQHQAGDHPFRIRTGGIDLFPRLGSVEVATETAPEMLRSGIDALDRLLGGGVERGTTTLIAGESGVGKTTIALQFLVHAAQQGERAELFSLDEYSTSMLHRAAALGIPAAEMVRAGRLAIERMRSTEMYPAEFALKVRRAIEAGARIILIDSLTAYSVGVSAGPRLAYHLSQIRDYLAHHQVTLFLTVEHSSGSALAVPDPLGVSYLADNILLLRLFEAQGEVHRAMSVLKKRMSMHETMIREYKFSERGIEIGDPVKEFQGVMSGTPIYTGESVALLDTDARAREQ